MDDNWNSPEHVASAFHLPEVCRQIYSETTLASYRENIFLCEDGYFNSKSPMYQFMDVQAEAITTLEIDLRMLYRMIGITGEFRPFRKNSNWGILSVLPNVRVVVITCSALEVVRVAQQYLCGFSFLGGARSSWTCEDWREFIAPRLKPFTDASVE